MASGDTLATFTALDNEMPSTAAAALDVWNGRPVLRFDAATDENSQFIGFLPNNYGAGGITVTICWLPAAATTGTCRWLVAIERLDDETTDLDSDSFATAQSAGGTAPGTQGQLQYTAVALTNSQIDSLVANEFYRIRVTRDADGTSGTDDMANDAMLVAVAIKET